VSVLVLSTTNLINNNRIIYRLMFNLFCKYQLFNETQSIYKENPTENCWNSLNFLFNQKLYLEAKLLLNCGILRQELDVTKSAVSLLIVFSLSHYSTFAPN